MWFLTNPLGRAVSLLAVISIIAGIAFFQHLMIQNLHQRLDLLDDRANALQAANNSLQHDIAVVQKLQQATNESLQAARLRSTEAAQIVQHRRFTGDPKLVQDEANKDTAAAFGRLQSLSHAP